MSRELVSYWTEEREGFERSSTDQPTGGMGGLFVGPARSARPAYGTRLIAVINERHRSFPHRRAACSRGLWVLARLPDMQPLERLIKFILDLLLSCKQSLRLKPL